MTSSETMNLHILRINMSSLLSAQESTASQTLFQDESMLPKIFRYLEQGDLAECSLVCHSWNRTSKPYLYRKVILNSVKSLQAFSSQIESNANKRLGYLVRDIHFGGSFRVSVWAHLLQSIAIVFYKCPKIVNITTAENRSLKEVVVHALTKLPNPGSRLKRLAKIPDLHGNKYYAFCIRMYSGSLREVSLNANQLTLDIIKMFPNLTKLSITEISCRSMTLYSILDTIPSLQDLTVDYPLSHHHFKDEFPSRFYPGMRSINLRIELSDNFHHLQVMHLLSFFVNLQSLNISLSDDVGESLRLGQMYAIEETISLINALGNSCINVYFHNANSNALNLSSYLECILNTLVPATPALKKSIVSLLITENLYVGDYIGYSTSDISTSKEAQLCQITLSNSKSQGLSDHIKLCSQHLNMLYIVCNDGASKFEAHSARLLKIALEECPQLNKLVLHGSNQFDDELPICSGNITELHLIDPHYNYSMQKDIPFGFPNLKKIHIQSSILKWKNDMYFHMPNNDLEEFCLDIGDYEDNYVTKYFLERSLFKIYLKLGGKEDSRYIQQTFCYQNSVVSSKNEDVKIKSRTFKINLEFNSLATILFKYGDSSHILWHKTGAL